MERGFLGLAFLMAIEGSSSTPAAVGLVMPKGTGAKDGPGDISNDPNHPDSLYAEIRERFHRRRFNNVLDLVLYNIFAIILGILKDREMTVQKRSREAESSAAMGKAVSIWPMI